jgi:hypothetical protein
MTGGCNPAATEWVNARLMGFDPRKIPLILRAFDTFSYPIAEFDPMTIRVRIRGADILADKVYPLNSRAFIPAQGWQGHCELDINNDHNANAQTLVG